MEALRGRPSSSEVPPKPMIRRLATYTSLKDRLKSLPKTPSAIFVPFSSTKPEPVTSFSKIIYPSTEAQNAEDAPAGLIAEIPTGPAWRPPLEHDRQWHHSPTPTTATQSASETSTTATSVLPLPHVFTVQKLHVCPIMSMDREIQTVWTRQIKARLSAVLLRSISRGTCVQEFMMVGKRPESLKPTLVITCGNTATKKQVEKTFKSQSWLQELLKANRIMFLAMVAETYLAAGPDLDNASTVKLSRSYAVQVPPSDVATACGLDLLIHTGDYRSLRHCTLGGLIVVNDQILGLTAGHPFSIIKHEKIPWEHLDVHQIVEDFGDEGNSTASSEPFVFNDDDDDRSDANRDSSASTSSVHEAGVLRPSIDARPYRRSEASRAFPSSMNSYPSQAAILPASSPAYVTPVDDLLIDHDWALLEALPHIVTSRPNKVAHIDQRRDSLIEGLVSGPACGEVTITTGGIGPQSGYLHSSPATMKVDTSVLEVQLITLERFLPLGSSGAWVILRDRLCGYIVAIRQDVPWAYMVAIEPVLKDIRRKLKTDDVRLLTAIEMDRLAASSKMASMKLSHELDEELPPRTSEADQANKPSKGSADLRTFSPRKKRRKTHKYLPAELQDGRANRESRLSRTPADGSLDEKSNIQDHAPQTSLVQPSLQPGDRRQEYSVVTAPTVGRSSSFVIPWALRLHFVITLSCGLWRRLKLLVLHTEVHMVGYRRRTVMISPMFCTWELPDYPDGAASNAHTAFLKIIQILWYCLHRLSLVMVNVLIVMLYFFVLFPVLFWVKLRHRDTPERSDTLPVRRKVTDWKFWRLESL